ncbi:MAG: aminopeptidase [Spirochaetaceae bacterium]|nr:aminopeptidase [Spirochaetaceae bacterium]
MKHHTVMYIAPSLIALVLVFLCSLLFSACYTLKEGTTMISYLRRAVPLESLAGEEPVNEDTVRFVENVRDIKRFTAEKLGLKVTKNYTSYVQLDRDYLAAIVSASAKDSFTTYQWWFPVVGKVPYKGFFNPQDAKKEAGKLEKKDLDVWIRPVSAFSTLGWFRDPLYSFMRNYSLERLADLIIHESFHATVFLTDHVQLNEELAEFVGSEGARLYIESKGGSFDYQKEDDAYEHDTTQFISFIQSLSAELELVYKSNIPRDEKLSEKEAIISAAQKRFADNYDTMFISDRYKGFANIKINNAYLELYNLYYGKSTKLKSLYIESGGDINNFINAAKKLNTKSDPMTQLERLLKAP